VDAVGIDANCPHTGPAAKQAKQQEQAFKQEVQQVAPKQNPRNGNWQVGDAPSQVLRWAVDALAKAGTLSIIGVYPPSAEVFPIGKAMNKNLTIRMGNCNHRKYIPLLLDLVQSGAIDPLEILTEEIPLTDAISAYEAFDRREAGWIKVALQPIGAS
jgi:threonine dehydrogenase-like Zn-dependent dehydrogenase